MTKNHIDDIDSLGVELPEDSLERMLVKFIYGLRAERRLYPDSYATELAEAVRNHIKGETK